AVAGVAAVPEWEVAAPATAAPPTAAPLRAATPSPSFLTLLSMIAPFLRPGTSRVRESRCSRRVGAPFGIARKVLRMGFAVISQAIHSEPCEGSSRDRGERQRQDPRRRRRAVDRRRGRDCASL